MKFFTRIMTLLAVVVATTGGCPAWTEGQHAFSTSKKILAFPKDRSLGTLTIRSTDKKMTTLEARGNITVPAGSRVLLAANFDSASNLSWLKQLPPDGITKLVLAKLDVNDSQMQNVASLTGLEALDICETEVTDKGLTALSGMTGLKELEVHEAMITGKGLKALTRLANLEYLCASSNKLGDAGIESLLPLKKLKLLNLARCGLTNRALSSIGKMTQLRHLDIQYNDAITDKGIASLAGLKNLRTLQLGETSIGGNSIKSLVKLTSLRHLIYSPQQFTRLDIKEIENALPNCKCNTILARRGIPEDLVLPKPKSGIYR